MTIAGSTKVRSPRSRHDGRRLHRSADGQAILGLDVHRGPGPLRHHRRSRRKVVSGWTAPSSAVAPGPRTGRCGPAISRHPQRLRLDPARPPLQSLAKRGLRGRAPRSRQEIRHAPLHAAPRPHDAATKPTMSEHAAAPRTSFRSLRNIPDSLLSGRQFAPPCPRGDRAWHRPPRRHPALRSLR